MAPCFSAAEGSDRLSSTCPYNLLTSIESGSEYWMAAVQSSRNPFRNLAATTSSSLPLSPQHSASAQSTHLSPAPTGNSTRPVNSVESSIPTSTSGSSSTAIEQRPSSSTDILSEELPPAYTPAANSQQGEQTVEYGPTRPFQNSAVMRPPTQQHAVTSHPTGLSTTQSYVIRPPPQPSQPQSLWRQITGSLADQLNTLSMGSNYNRYGTLSNTHYTGYGTSPPVVPSLSTVPPPLPPRSNPVPPPLPPRNNASQVSPRSEFAQDFYAAGTGSSGELEDPHEHPPSRYVPPPGPPPSEAPNEHPPSRYAPPPGPPPSEAPNVHPPSRYALPPGLPPSEAPNEHPPSRYAPPPGPPPPSGSPPSHATAPDDDGRPTRTPVPGHPLLNQGRILVYPSGYECEKCHNVGYKQNDPTHPCRKCWSKYAKPFTGAITYSSFKSSSTGSGKTLQRPLPLLRPPQAKGFQHNTDYPGSYTQHRGQGQNQYSPPPHPPPGPFPPNPPPPNIQMIPGGYLPNNSSQPPPGVVVYAPGDPRLGGRLCWRCDGDGIIGGFLFEEQCSVCGGVGRTFR
ncbi:hypothetical protein GYMLUDRAFT_796932 [Collybiopsis luxurians FD-317 M1]|nr:hypothetical protein GYMLUDRAFT_796932 [Collybiopsis luxurians FD-317 M1]